MKFCAGGGNRTPDISLARIHFTTKLHPLKMWRWRESNPRLKQDFKQFYKLRHFSFLRLILKKCQNRLTSGLIIFLRCPQAKSILKSPIIWHLIGLSDNQPNQRLRFKHKRRKVLICWHFSFYLVFLTRRPDKTLTCPAWKNLALSKPIIPFSTFKSLLRILINLKIKSI